MPKIYVIQKPRHETDFDMSALEALGEVEYLLPAAPNAFDKARIEEDTRRVAGIMEHASDQDMFVALGGAPISHHIFGSAFVLAGRRSINYGIFSRGRDGDGRRGGVGGSYRFVPLDLGLDDPINAPAAA